MVSYSAAISACEKNAQWQKALGLFQAMCSSTLSPDVISYSATISACEKGGQWQHALNLLLAMRQDKVRPNVISYSAAISACEKGGQWQRALILFEAMNEIKVNPNAIICSATISAYEKGDQWQQALNLFEAMVGAKVEPDIVTYNALLACRDIYGNKNLGGHIFQHGLLPILHKSTEFHHRMVDLHEHSEGSARLTLQWWLSTTVAKHLQDRDRLDCIVVTGYGKSRQAWDTTDVQAAARDLLKSLKLDARVLATSLAKWSTVTW